MPLRKPTDHPRPGRMDLSRPITGNRISFVPLLTENSPTTVSGGRGRGTGRGRGRPRGSRGQGRGRGRGGRGAAATISPRNGGGAKSPTTRGNRRSGRKSAGQTSKFREQSVASSSKVSASRRSSAAAAKRPCPWEVSDDEEEVNEPRGWNRANLSASEPEEEEEEEELGDESASELFAASDRSTSEDEAFDLDASTSMPMDEEGEEDEDQQMFCPWAELSPEEIPPLELPGSSADLLIDSSHLMETLEIYEVLLNFGPIIQLSPFLFEDFCCALRNQSQSKLLAEIHIAFLRLFFREEELEHTTFTPTETALSFGIILQLLDHMNYAEVLRHYVESDPSFSADVLDILTTSNYPFVSLEKRLIVLRWLCDRFFDTSLFKKTVKNGGRVKHDQNCRNCAKGGSRGEGGDLLACAGCEAIYHWACVGLTPEALAPEEQHFWLCPVCQKHQVRGATDCMLPGQSALRKLPLGYDRHGRIYWFLARRIFIHDPASELIYYYSTLPQLYDLICVLDPKNFERRLCRLLGQMMPDIAVQMHTTLELTDERRRQLQAKSQKEIAEPYLQVDNAHQMAKILSDAKAEKNGNAESRQLKREKVREGNDGEEHDEEDRDQREANEEEAMDAQDGQHQDQDDDEDEETLQRRLRSDIVQMARHYLCIGRNNRLEAPFWSGGVDEEQLLADYQHWQMASLAVDGGHEFGELTSDLDLRMRRGIRLGFSDAGHRTYVNAYASDELAKSPYQRAKERDRRRYLNSRFCISDEGEFTWPLQRGASPFGSEPEVLRCIVLSFRRLLDRVPDGLMHRRWLLDGQKERFMQRLLHCQDVGTLRELLLLFERAIRKPAFLNIWWGSLALTKLTRVTSEDRERRQKFEGQRKKEEKLLATASPADPNASDIVWVKYSLYGGQPPKHNIWKTRDSAEQYRINGLGELGGWLWMSSTLVRQFVPAPEKPNVQKMSRLRRIANKLLMWRTVEELAAVHRKQQQQRWPRSLACYSPNCRLITESCAAGSPAIGAFCSYNFGTPLDQGFLLPCYNRGCARNRMDPSRTSRSTRAKPPNRRSQQGTPQQQQQQKSCLQLQQQSESSAAGVPGEDLPFPFPAPYNFRRKSGKESILVLPEGCLKRMARQGGLSSTKLVVPGFHSLAAKKLSVWPYPCARPLFDHCWRYLTACRSKTVHALALRFRQMYASIRWMDLWPEDPDDPDIRVWTHHPDHDEVRTVCGHKENPPDGYYEQYKIRVDHYSLLEDVQQNGSYEDDDFLDSSGTGRRRGTRKRQQLQRPIMDARMANRRRRVTKTEERWIDGVELKLYEIADYWHDYLTQQEEDELIPQQKVESADDGTSAAQSYEYYSNQQQQPTTAKIVKVEPRPAATRKPGPPPAPSAALGHSQYYSSKLSYSQQPQATMMVKLEPGGMHHVEPAHHPMIQPQQQHLMVLDGNQQLPAQLRRKYLVAAVQPQQSQQLHTLNQYGQPRRQQQQPPRTIYIQPQQPRQQSADHPWSYAPAEPQQPQQQPQTLRDVILQQGKALAQQRQQQQYQQQLRYEPPQQEQQQDHYYYHHDEPETSTTTSIRGGYILHQQPVMMEQYQQQQPHYQQQPQQRDYQQSQTNICILRSQPQQQQVHRQMVVQPQPYRQQNGHGRGVTAAAPKDEPNDDDAEEHNNNGYWASVSQNEY